MPNPRYLAERKKSPVPTLAMSAKICSGTSNSKPYSFPCMASPARNITRTHAVKIRPRTHRPSKTCPRPGRSHAAEQIARAAGTGTGRDVSSSAPPTNRIVSSLCSIEGVKDGEFAFEVATFQAYNLKNLVSTLFSRNHQDRRSRHVEKL